MPHILHVRPNQLLNVLLNNEAMKRFPCYHKVFNSALPPPISQLTRVWVNIFWFQVCPTTSASRVNSD
ncbi:hypothetical protein M413DRAFT_445464 [Hebeloma cylindrosporum]|uniref:Uncharacterized protein n=1 Tax=Hebeloma cylindrosporum TaxID=76867 RepID=A0A0C3BY06_HEBCY|nr:hypothetical protein M413DRAFT_445464 [Hebeloma cylindrosporum h7]